MSGTAYSFVVGDRTGKYPADRFDPSGRRQIADFGLVNGPFEFMWWYAYRLDLVS